MMNKFKKPSNESDRRALQEIERLIIRDYNPEKEKLKNESPWDVTISTISKSNLLGTLQRSPVSNQLSAAIKSYLQRDDFHVKFYFRGRHLEKTEDLT